MQLQSSATDEETEDDTDDTLIDPHMLVLQPISTEDTNVIMEEDESLIANQNLDPFGSNIQPTSATDISNADQNLTLTGLSTPPTSVTDVSTLHLEGEPTLFEVIEQASNDFLASQPSVLDQDKSPSTVLVGSPKEPTIKKEMSSEAFPPLPSSGMPEIPVMMTAPLPHGPVLLIGIYYQPVPMPHNVVVAQSTVPAPTIVPCTPDTEPRISATSRRTAGPCSTSR